MLSMAKRLKITKSKYSESFYIIDDFTNPQTNKHSTFIVERLGSLDSLKEAHHVSTREEVLSILQDYIASIRLQDKLDKAVIPVNLSPNKIIPIDEERLYNIGYLYIKNILSSLKLKDICQSINSKYKYQFDLYSIISDLISTRIIYPGSKRSSYKDAFHFLDTPQYQLEDVYRSLPILDKERYYIESELYKNSHLVCERDNSILYYDCTNFYFEIEQEDEFRKYGKSKENRPNPIVQYGLFMDAKGIPIADIVFEGNKNEQFSMRELETQIEKDFEFSKFIVCADAGLNGWENKIYNDKKKHGAYIVTQPIKKWKASMKKWAVDPKGWRILGQEEIYDISQLPEKIKINNVETSVKELTFYKDRWEKTIRKSEQTIGKYTLEEHYIVTYSQKYKDYQIHIREKKLERARKLLSNPGKIKTNNPRDPRYYIQSSHSTNNGEVAKEAHYELDEKKIKEDSLYDGFYAVATDLEDDDLTLIIKSNKQRWEIEESFEIMKSELKTRPMYVSSKEAIHGHLLTCFIALLVYRLLEKEYLKERYTCPEVMNTLRALNITHLGGNVYVPSFKRTELIDHLASEFGFQPAREVLTQKYLKKFSKVVNSKKSTKLK